MTEPAETEITPVAEPVVARRGTTGAILLALLALVIAVAAVTVPYMPFLQRYLPQTQQTQVPDYGNAVSALQTQLRDIAEKQAVAPAQVNPVAFDAAPLNARIEKLEQQLIAADIAISEAKAKTQDGTVRPVALAFIRVENRLLRGEPFVAELQLLKQYAAEKLTADMDRDLTAASSGVRPTAELVNELRDLERSARRAERMATVDGPLARIWAELQSLVLIKDSSVSTAPDDRIAALIAAVRQGEKGVTEAAWQPIPNQAKQVLYPVYGEVERRQRAEGALKQLAPAALATQ